MSDQILGVIPARYASTRLPGKPLALIGTKPMIQWTYHHASLSKSIHRLVVATDDKRIHDVVLGFGGESVLTSPDHPTGTDRIIEVAEKYPSFGIILNIQGDEPGMESKLIDGVLDLKTKHRNWEMTTAAVPFTSTEDPKDPNKVKVVFDKTGRANYFSRSPIPASFKGQATYHRHLGIYAYEREFLMNYNHLPTSDWETVESLEQLRALQNGSTIGVYLSDKANLGVDSPADLAVVIRDFKEKGLI
ncbi:3-deoxy-manno-octulosonate cytidylyltransferase [Leptospira montravelensis]|uniref:3-deoxy-manno-octulosonate cytidylyltransferase n=1 Tax=Leptospira montravelensis TaxID=2484961 RepID=A0ABY2LMY6_9LEPT|nr:3-deoxy-manno-octulosonate cytidylyltransferase [Leptospira montravelensis]TGK80363.1 3-deoxy-manno-octulosonate cytidylyltransferase [Leptospira montravelensis]TGL00539.1 3-deoxy-manno-octulosonate cytidylyltransferase [Leptospira montravelensis]